MLHAHQHGISILLHGRCDARYVVRSVGSSPLEHESRLTLHFEGLLAAGWLSEDRFLRIGCAFTMVMPASLAFLFCWMQIGHFIRYIKERAERGDSDDEESIKGEVKAEIKAEPESMTESPPNTAI